jgi:hypothetical protein
MASERQPPSDATSDAAPDRFIEQSGPVYLTLVSIIQAAVLGYMMTYLHDPLVPLTVWTAGRLLGSFLYVIGLWYAYTCQAVAFRWVPGLADAVIPFVLGALQCLAVRSAGSIFWWCISNAGFASAGALAFVNLDRCAARHPENASALCRLGRRRALSPVFMAVSVAWYLGIAMLLRSPGPAEGLATLGGLVPPIAFLAWSTAGHRIVLGQRNR